MASDSQKPVQRLRVEGMSCPGCADNVEKALRGLSGVEDVKVYLSEGTASVTGAVEPQDLVGALSGTNYQARPLAGS